MNATYKELYRFSKKEVEQAFSQALTTNSIPGLKLLQTPTKEIPHGKILIVIPKKTGKAHDRNRIKRQIKALFYEEKLYEKPIVSIILVYKQALDLSYSELKAFFLDSFSGRKAS